MKVLKLKRCLEWGTLLVFVLLAISLAYKHFHKAPAAKNTYTVEAKRMPKRLYFSGTMLPLKEVSLVNALEGVVEAMNFHYGQMIQKDELVFTVVSSDLQKQFNETLTEYLKAKDNLGIIQAKFAGTEELWTEGLIAKNNYLSEKSSLNSAELGLMQATRKLSELLEKTGEDSYANLSELSLKEFDKVRQALSLKHNMVYLKALDSGVLLYPPKSNSETAAHPISVGSTVKAGQVLGLIGDLKGLRIEIEIAEVDIPKIKIGMPAVIRANAYKEEALSGELVSINAEASNSNNAHLPSFLAIVEVKSLTAKEQAEIKVGMSATVELLLEEESRLLIPKQFVKEKDGRAFVRIKKPSGQIKTQRIQTGDSFPDAVTVLSGLKPGDLLVMG